MACAPYRLPLIRLAAIGLAGLMLAGCQQSRIAAIDRDFPVDYRQRHPIMVSTHGARVAHPCGQWPHDLGPADGTLSAMNHPHWNHGCATQHNLAAIVANPNDLLAPRAEQQADAARRQTAIGRYRLGTAPGPHTIHTPIQALTDVRSAVRGN
ncbi:CpaD family pilus assembly lipoprotein [Phreatobacter sp.]|uniref:CpaD family pilus assembly lipoprotein n=1 Tax=Phreatobacter sp. TaxID=1966341 RepID=UPI003F716A59